MTQETINKISAYMPKRFPDLKDFKVRQQTETRIKVFETFNGRVMEHSRVWTWKRDVHFGWVYWDDK